QLLVEGEVHGARGAAAQLAAQPVAVADPRLFAAAASACAETRAKTGAKTGDRRGGGHDRALRPQLRPPRQRLRVIEIGGEEELVVAARPVEIAAPLGRPREAEAGPLRLL